MTTSKKLSPSQAENVAQQIYKCFFFYAGSKKNNIPSQFASAFEKQRAGKLEVKNSPALACHRLLNAVRAGREEMRPIETIEAIAGLIAGKPIIPAYEKISEVHSQLVREETQAELFA